MFQSISCELCINICNGHRRLYDDDGHRNEVYAMTKKYFSPMLESVDNMAVICLECWRHIFEFHTFQQSISLAHEIGQFSKRTAEVVKSKEENPELDEEEFITIAAKSVVMDEQWPREVLSGPEDFTNATKSEFSIDEQSRTSVKSDIAEPMDDHESDSQQTGASLEAVSLEDPEESDMADEWDDLVDTNDASDVGQGDASSEYRPESDGNFSSVTESAGLPKKKHLKPGLQSDQQPTTSRIKLKRPETVQEYDDLIAQWRPNLECVECGETSPSFSLLQQHFAEQHPTAKCHIPCCELKLYHRYELEKHIRVHTEPKPFKCEQCDRCFATKKSLETHHYRIHYGTSKNGFQCPKCSKTYSRKYVLKYHMKYRCNIDGKQLTKLAARGKHTCGECGKVTTTLQLLQDHTVKFHATPGKIPTMTCTICDKVYTNAVAFREHKSSHTGEPLYHCPFCPKEFTLGSCYYGHLKRWHRQEWSAKLREKAQLKKMYKCTICECTYDIRGDLRVHMAKHTGKALYTCAFCPRTFIFRVVFAKHLQLMHPKEWEEKGEASDELASRKVFKCAKCEEVFQTRIRWRKHQDTHPGD